MGRNGKSTRDVATRMATGLAEATAAAAAFRNGWQRPVIPRDPGERMALEHERQQRDYQRSLKRYQSRLSRLKSRAQAMTIVAVVGGSVALVDLLSAGPEAPFVIGLPAAVVGATVATSARRSAAELVPPTPPTAPPPPPRPLPPGVPGSAESAHLHRVRVQLSQLIPTIAGLHEDAAIELRRADFEAAPAMAALVDRLAVLHRVAVEMQGTPAARTAWESSEEVRRRLAQGVAMYEELLNATLQMLSAPDPHRAPSARLEHTVRELTAYTEGLRVAGESTIP